MVGVESVGFPSWDCSEAVDKEGAGEVAGGVGRVAMKGGRYAPGGVGAQTEVAENLRSDAL